jgi:TRAP-type mannitol/chloroaromatic compound transport system substrate-binding protein
MALIALFLAGPVHAGNTYKLTTQCFISAGLSPHWDAAQHFKEQCEKLSNGRLKIRLLPSGSIVPTMEMLDAVHKGALDISLGWASYWRGSFPAAPLFGAVECGPGTKEYLAWALQGDGLELWQEMYDNKNWQVKVLPPWCAHGPEDLAWSNKPIRSLEDFKGLRFRTGGYYWGKVLEKMGASVVTLPGSEVIPALERGVIDAGEFSMPMLDIKMGFHEVCKYLCLPGIHQPSSLDETLVNIKKWNALPKDLQEIMISAAKEASLFGMTLEIRENPKAFDEFKKKGIQILTLSPETQAKAKELANQVHDQTAAKYPFFKKVLENQRAFFNKYNSFKADFESFDYGK